MDDNYIVNRIIDILNNENKNLLIGNITSPRPGTICQVSTNYGIKSAYNINCTYPGDACVVWDKDEQRYYCFTVKPNEVISSRQLSFRKNRPQDKVKKTDNLVKILYKSTIGTTVKICIGGSYEVPKVLFTYQTNSLIVTDFKINSTGEREDNWIVGFKVGNNINNLLIGNFYVYEGSTTVKHISDTVYIGNTDNIGRGYFEAKSLYIWAASQDGSTPSYSNVYETFTGSGVNRQIFRTFPNFINGTIVNTTYSGIITSSVGALSIPGLLSGLFQGTGVGITYAGTPTEIKSQYPYGFGTIDGNIQNIQAYKTFLVGNKNQYMYRLKYEHTVSGEAKQNKLYLVSDTYGTIFINNIDNSSEAVTFFYYPNTNWINDSFSSCSLLSSTITAIIGTGIKTIPVLTWKLINNAIDFTGAIYTGISGTGTIEAKCYSIPKATNETIEILGASYFYE